MRAGTTKKAKAFGKPIPFILDEEGNVVTTCEERAQVFFQHFAKAEAGTAVSAHDLLVEVMQRQRRQIEDGVHPELEHITALQDLEIAILLGRRGSGTGMDVIPYEVLKLCPQLFALFTLPLALKTTALLAEPLQYKGGIAQELVKSRGSHKIVDSFRSILLEDHIGKTAKKSARQNLIPYASDYMMDTQQCGLPRRGTDFAAHILRLFVESSFIRKKPGAIIFVDLKSAFYSVLREIVMSMDTSDDGIVHLFATLNLPDNAFEEFCEVLANLPILEQAGVPRHLQRIVAEMHTDTWFTMEGVPDLAKTSKGTRPGDPLADLVFNFVAAKIFKDVRTQMHDSNLGFVVTSQDTEIESQVSYADDLAVMLQSDTFEEVRRATQHALKIIIDTLAKFGFTVNRKKNKTEVMLLFNGPGQKAAENEVWQYDSPTITVHSDILGELDIVITRSYEHLGGTAHYRNDMYPEVAKRAAQSSAAELPIRRTILCSRIFDCESRWQLSVALSLSKLNFNAAIWSRLNDKQNKCFCARYNNMLRGAHNKLNHKERHWSNNQVYAAANVLKPSEYMSTLRLKYLWRAANFAPDVWWGMVFDHADAPRCWAQMVTEDIQWLKRFLDSDDDVQSCVTAAQLAVHLTKRSKRSWTAKVKKASQRAIRDARIHDDLLTWQADLDEVLGKAGLPRIHSGPSPHRTFYCIDCKFQSFSKQGLAAHRSAIHDEHHPANFFFDGPTCAWCLKHFHTANRSLRHLKSSNRCFLNLQHWYQPFKTEVVKLAGGKSKKPIDHGERLPYVKSQ